MTDRPSRVVLLAGGVGGARMAVGLARALPAGALTVIVNVGDDDEFHGLRVCPDLDTILYTLSGQVGKHGWGVEGDTTRALDVLKRLGATDTWMTLGDADMGLHLYRTSRLREGWTLTEVIRDVGQSIGLQVRILPVTNERVSTLVVTGEGRLRFQEWFVKHRCGPSVLSLSFEGAHIAGLTPEATEALMQADLIVYAPSNPFLSIQPMLEISSMRRLLRERKVPAVVVSPLINGLAVKGPLHALMQDMRIASGNPGIADFYGDLVDAIVIDASDEADAPGLRRRGLQTLCAPTRIAHAHEAQALARMILTALWSLHRPGAPS